VADAERDLAKIAVVERHLGSGRVGLGFVRGFTLRRGAIASSVAHDAHNLVVVGMNDASMAAAVRRLANRGGGIVVVDGAEVLAELPLPIAGLLSDAPHDVVVERSRQLIEAARELGCTLESPFQHLAFLALSVIPSLKLTDRGLVDVDRFELVPLELGA
jgi:adenine deaminase